jgi:hypothetical protein
MPWVLVAFGSVLMALVLGTIVVVTPLGIRELAALAWMIALGVVVRRISRRGERKLAAMFLVLQIIVACAVLVAASAAPGKTKDKVLSKHMALPGQDLTLAELQQCLEFSGRPIDRVPIRISLTFAEGDGATEIHFPAENLTLREFIASLESQSNLRAKLKFSSCGNGHTILWGEDCCFGLHFRECRRPY